MLQKNAKSGKQTSKVLSTRVPAACSRKYLCLTCSFLQSDHHHTAPGLLSIPNIKDLSRELKLGIAADPADYRSPTVRGRVSRWMSRSISSSRSSSSSARCVRFVRGSCLWAVPVDGWRVPSSIFTCSLQFHTLNNFHVQRYVLHICL